MDNITLDVTQRAYTLRLRGSGTDDTVWRDALWRTHEAVNKGARTFGDVLLTLRGGLCHELAELPVKAKKGEMRPPTAEERKNRRILLALSWLAVEDEHGAPKQFVVSHNGEPDKVLAALRGILAKRGLAVADIDAWLADCTDSLKAAIRKDAVWGNRSAQFDELCANLHGTLDRDSAEKVIFEFFGQPEAYLAPIRSDSDEDDGADNGDTDASPNSEEKPKEFPKVALGWLCTNWGSGKKSDKGQIVEMLHKAVTFPDVTGVGLSGCQFLTKLAEFVTGTPLASEAEPCDVLCKAIGWGSGRVSKGRMALESILKKPAINVEDITKLKQKLTEEATEKAGKVGAVPTWVPQLRPQMEASIGLAFRQDKDLSFEFAVMLDHAARRVSLAHTWIKRAEAERRKFTKDVEKLAEVPASVKVRLDDLCGVRSADSGALGGYGINPRALGGWDKIVAEWARLAGDGLELERVEAVHKVQAEADADNGKFGDEQLFKRLAVDDARCAWFIDGKADHEPLKKYAAAMTAHAKMQRFKVPAYRHPDALRHPVFCDFGNSRWEIKFATLDAVSKLDAARQTIIRRTEALDKAKQALEKAKTPEKQEAARAKITEVEKALAEANHERDWLANGRALSMKLWDGAAVKPVSLGWQSKRMGHDLSPLAPGSAVAPTGNVVSVTRNDRLSRAAAGASADSAVEVDGLFTQTDWNGRLQAPRRQLDALAKIQDNEKMSKAERDRLFEKRKVQINWLVSFSAKLTPQGPWVDFAAKNNLKTDPVYWPHSEENKKRKGMAKLILCRLPGLRVLSVDLGHRYAASCTVWETLTLAQVQELCRAANAAMPKAEALYCHLTVNGKKVVLRRIGADALPDGLAHPAPWARLERQFLIKLQGEEEPPRKASPAEFAMLAKLEAELGVIKRDAEVSARKPRKDVLSLMDRAVNLVRLVLKRHADYARIAYAFSKDAGKLMPGGKVAAFANDGERTDAMQDALLSWHGLASSSRWQDKWAAAAWNDQIKPLLAADSALFAPEESEDGQTPMQRKKKREERKAALRGVAETFAKSDNMKRHVAWSEQWRVADAEMQKQLRGLRNWIMPRGARKDSPEIRHVGGLSTDRIALFRELYQLMKAFHMRPEPCDLRKNVPERDDDGMKDFGGRILEAHERLRENRVKQVANRIAAAALGLVGHWEEYEQPIRDTEGHPQYENGKRVMVKKWRWMEEATPKYTACHAVIIENLTNYRPDETQMRRENRQLMQWASSKVKKYLADACQLNGLHLREVSPGYTSRQDSRTGAPGMRCNDISVKEFLESAFWKKRIEQAQVRIKTRKDKPEDHYLCGLRDRLAVMPEAKRPASVRIPQRGGELFVSADGASPAAKGLQADLNAAANIGLLALLDPDWPGRWWRLLCSSDGKPDKEKMGGSAAVPEQLAVAGSAEKASAKTGKAKEKKDKVNLWRDPSADKLNTVPWMSTQEYWRDAEKRVCHLLASVRAGVEGIPA